jgi:hypothetical protein
MPIEDNSASVRGYWQAWIAADTFAKSVGTFRSRARVKQELEKALAQDGKPTT